MNFRKGYNLYWEESSKRDLSLPSASHTQLAAQGLDLVIPQVAAVGHLVGIGKIGNDQHGGTRQLRGGDAKLEVAPALLVVHPVKADIEPRAHSYLVGLLRCLVPEKSKLFAVALHIVGKPVGQPVFGPYIRPQ